MVKVDVNVGDRVVFLKSIKPTPTWSEGIVLSIVKEMDKSKSYYVETYNKYFLNIKDYQVYIFEFGGIEVYYKKFDLDKVYKDYGKII